MTAGYFGVAVWHPKFEVNVGSLWRTAHLFGAAFVATVGTRYRVRQPSDTMHTTQHIPLHHFDTIDDLVAGLPNSCPLIGVELDPRAVPLNQFAHPLRALYLLGAEDHGLPPAITDRCHYLVQVPSVVNRSMNVANAGAIVIYDRHANPQRRLTRRAMKVAGL